MHICDDSALLEHLALLVAFVLDDLQPQRRAKLFDLFLGRVDFAVSAATCSAAGPWQFSQPLPTRSGVSFSPRKPDSNGKYFCGSQPVAWQLTHSGSKCRGGSRFTSVSVAWECGVFSYTSVAVSVAVGARLAAGELAAGGCGLGFSPSPSSPSVFELLLILDVHLVDFRRIGKAMIERHALVAKRRGAVLVKADDDDVHSLVADFDQLRLACLRSSPAPWAAPRRRGPSPPNRIREIVGPAPCVSSGSACASSTS